MDSDESLMPQVLYSAEAERAVLGCCMAQPAEVIPETDSLLKTDFFVPAHQELYVVLRDMFTSSETIDVISIHQRLVDRKLHETVGSPGILSDLLMGFATHLNVGTYIRIVKNKALLRALQNACSRIVQDIVDMPDSVASVMDRAEKAIFDVTERELTRGAVSIRSAAECVAVFRAIRQDVADGKKQNRILTGLPTLDGRNGGLPKPSYVVIAGEQGSGKSALMLSILKYCCWCGWPVGVFSMEMTINQIVQRQVAEVAGMDSRRLNGKIHDWEHAKTETALDAIAHWPYFIDDQANLSPSDLCAGVRRFVKLGCQVVFIDNLQLARGSDDRDMRVRQLTEVSRTIQFLQKEYDLTIILLAQVTREAKKKTGDKSRNLQAFDIADCSAIENDARVLIMLEKGEGAESASSSAYPVTIRIAKYSEGEQGDFDVTFNKKEQRITEVGSSPVVADEEQSPFLPV